MTLQTRPAPEEYAPYYAGYIARVPEGDVLDTLERQIAETLAILRDIPEAKAGHRYATGKWSIREVVGHMADTERIFAYRALRVGRGDRTPLPGFEQDDYVRLGGHDEIPLLSLVDELAAVRAATLALFRNFPAPALERRGLANGVEISARALAWIIAGHERHHVALLRTHYL